MVGRSYLERLQKKAWERSGAFIFKMKRLHLAGDPCLDVLCSTFNETIWKHLQPDVHMEEQVYDS